jgi:hypothetical protein
MIVTILRTAANQGEVDWAAISEHHKTLAVEAGCSSLSVSRSTNGRRNLFTVSHWPSQSALDRYVLRLRQHNPSLVSSEDGLELRVEPHGNGAGELHLIVLENMIDA